MRLEKFIPNVPQKFVEKSVLQEKRRKKSEYWKTSIRGI
jgi:hypothetical protein